MLNRHGPSSTYRILFSGSRLLLKTLYEYSKVAISSTYMTKGLPDIVIFQIMQHYI